MEFVKRRRLNNERSDSGLVSAEHAWAGLFGLVFLALFVLFPVAVNAADNSVEPVTFAIADVWPWAYVDQQGEPRGSLVDVMNRLSELTGVPVVPRIRPVRRALVELHSGDVNFSILFKSPSQDRQAVNIAPLVQFDILLAAPADSDYPLTLDALAGKPVAFIRGTYLGEAFGQDTAITKVPVTLIRQAVELLSVGRISAILGSDHAILRTLQTMGLRSDELRYAKHVPGQLGVLYMSLKAQRPEVAEQFRAAVATMTENGELQKIFFGEAGRPEFDGYGQSAAQ